MRQVVSVGASRALVGLDFGQDELRLSVSDDWVGLPDDYEEQGHGFANMLAYAERLGGRLIVRAQGAGRGRERNLRDAVGLRKTGGIGCQQSLVA